MSNLESRILSKISELDEVIEIAGKQYGQTKDLRDLHFVCRRIEAREKLYLYLNNL